MVAESSEFQLTLSRVYFLNSKYAQNRDILSEKRDGAKKA